MPIFVNVGLGVSAWRGVELLSTFFYGGASLPLQRSRTTVHVYMWLK